MFLYCICCIRTHTHLKYTVLCCKIYLCCVASSQRYVRYPVHTDTYAIFGWMSEILNIVLNKYDGYENNHLQGYRATDILHKWYTLRNKHACKVCDFCEKKKLCVYGHTRSRNLKNKLTMNNESHKKSMHTWFPRPSSFDNATQLLKHTAEYHNCTT
jgi:hypothetical protein